MESDFRNAAKAFIVQNGELLLLKRRPNDPHKPGEWDIPGGRLEPGESPYIGLQRETFEETNLQIEMVIPLDIHYFSRDDEQRITMMIFLCKITRGEIELSEEHTEYKWMDLRNHKDDFPPWLHRVIDRYNQVKYSFK